MGSHGLIDAWGGYLNSTSWVCLAISFLQSERFLPAYCNAEHCSGQLSLFPVRLTPGLLCRFFRFAVPQGELLAGGFGALRSRPAQAQRGAATAREIRVR